MKVILKTGINHLLLSEERSSYYELEIGPSPYWHTVISPEVNTALQVPFSVFFEASPLFKTPAFDFSSL